MLVVIHANMAASRRFTTQTLLKHGHRHCIDLFPVFFQPAYLNSLIVRHSVGVIILDTDILWTQTATV